MKIRTRLLALVLPALLLGGCVTAATRSTTWGQESYGYGPGGNWARYGHVENVRETVHAYQGDPGAGAVAGAIIGSLLFGGHSPGGTMFGAVGGAMVGAAASSGHAEERVYEVFVRFDDGALENYVYRDVLPFRPGDRVVLTAQGLMRQ
jgi:outer membrane lipoprotein SlyB